MKGSPLAIISLSLLSAALAWPQTNSPEPQPASGAPKTPMGSPQTTGPTTQGTQPATPKQQSQPMPSPQLSTPQQPLSPALPLIAMPVNPPPNEPEQPKTEIFDSSGTGLTTDGHDPILDPPPLPEGNATLVGGIVSGVDHVRSKMTLRVFGGGHWKIAYDERTHIFRNGAETTQLAIKKGERVYVDTMFDGKKHEVFARNIRVGIQSPAADADGQITEVDTSSGSVTLRDRINSSPIQFSVNNETRIVYGTNPASLNQLKPGSLVHVRFSPERVNRGLAREITIIAAPGSAFTYVGKITYLDMHRGLLAMENSLDQKNYEIHFDPAQIEGRDNLAIGSEVRIVTVFQGSHYMAQSITLTKSAEAANTEKE